jgi:protein-S-isoprenylcysteine O-methyltransferase Ste14
MAAPRVLPTTYLAGAIVAIVVLHLLLPLARAVPAPWSYFGAVPLGLGVALNLVADRAFKRRATTVKPLEQPSALITTGAFRLTRNPMYLGFVLLLGGLAVLLGSLTPYAVVVGFAVAMDRLFIRFEEATLQERFGADWLVYRARVRRWI